MWRYNNIDELYHYGILGMKWGRRKAKATRSEDSQRVKTIRKKKISQMSNQELSDVNKRLQLENNYRSLRSQSNAGKRIAQAIVVTGATIGGIKVAIDNFGWAKNAAKGAIDKIGGMVLRK